MDARRVKGQIESLRFRFNTIGEQASELSPDKEDAQRLKDTSEAARGGLEDVWRAYTKEDPAQAGGLLDSLQEQMNSYQMVVREIQSKSATAQQFKDWLEHGGPTPAEEFPGRGGRPPL